LPTIAISRLGVGIRKVAATDIVTRRSFESSTFGFGRRVVPRWIGVPSPSIAALRGQRRQVDGVRLQRIVDRE